VDSVLEATLRTGDDVTVATVFEPRPGERLEHVWARALARGLLRARPAGASAWLRLDEPPPKGAAGPVTVQIDRLRAAPENRMRLREAIELAWREGEGKLEMEHAGRETLSYADGRVCERCGRSFSEPRPQLFSFNSPYGACAECKGFGNILTFTLDRVVPDPGKSVLEGRSIPGPIPGGRTSFRNSKTLPPGTGFRSTSPSDRSGTSIGRSSSTARPAFEASFRFSSGSRQGPTR